MDNNSYPKYLFHEGTNYNAYELMAPKKLSKNRWQFKVYAPSAQKVSLVGDFNKWDTEKNIMKRDSGGIYECTVSGLKTYDNYKYCIKTKSGKILYKADPYAYHAETTPGTASKLYDISGYEWHDKDYLKNRKEVNIFESPMNIYEVHIGSWKRNGDGTVYSYRKFADEIIPYIKEMNYTHIELMPITEYPFDGSWGYQVTGLFAPTSRYGTPDDFMYLVDKCHEAGIGVILDWVIAHFPKDAHGLYEFDGTSLYEYSDKNKREHKEWGTMVFDYGKTEVKSFLISSAMFWVEKYHIDGLRTDAVASMLYLDYNRRGGEWTKNKYGGNYNLEVIDFLRELNKAVLSNHPDVLMIAEESTAFPMVTKPPHDGGLGFNFKWNMGWMNDSLSYVSANPFFKKDMHNKITFSITYAYSENYILPLSHDEVVHGKCSLINKMPGEYKQKFQELKAFFGYMMAHPGKKLLFMGGEFGQFVEWKYYEGLEWFLLNYDEHKHLQDFVKELNAYYLNNKEMYELDDSYDGFKWICVDDNTQNIISFRRMAKDGEYTVCVVNFAPVERKGYKMGMPEKGRYYTALTSESGAKWKKAEYTSKKGKMHGLNYFIDMDIPASSVTYLKFKKRGNK